MKNQNQDDVIQNIKQSELHQKALLIKEQMENALHTEHEFYQSFVECINKYKIMVNASENIVKLRKELEADDQQLKLFIQ